MTQKKEKSPTESKKSPSVMTIERFISITGGISELNRKALVRKYGKVEKTDAQWRGLLIALTIISSSSAKKGS